MKRYAKEFKAEALKLVSGGESYQDVAKELSVNPGTLYDWIRASKVPNRKLPLLLVYLAAEDSWVLKSPETKEGLKEAIIEARGKGADFKLVREVPCNIEVSWEKEK